MANAANTSALLFKLLPDVNWVGFYIADGNQLVLGPFQGNPACSRIPFGKGVCGTAAAKRQTVIVPDVKCSVKVSRQTVRDAMHGFQFGFTSK